MPPRPPVLKEIVLAGPRGFCAGVERAIEVVERTLDVVGGPIYVRREIVHNRHVVEALRDKGAIFVDELDEVPAGGTVIFSAHGVSPAVCVGALARGLTLAEVEREFIQRVLTAEGGNKTRAAQRLGLDRKTLYRKLEEYAAEGGPSGGTIKNDDEPTEND